MHVVRQSAHWVAVADGVPGVRGRLIANTVAELHAECEAAAPALRKSGVSVRDAAALLGISKSRVDQLGS